MFKKILIALVVILGALLVVVALQPADFRVSRSMTINAPAAEVFAQVNDFHKWEAWSPWAKLDPNAKATFEGPASGEGAIFKWSGNKEVGEGTNTIVESVPNERIKIKLDFVKPMESTANVDFQFKEDAGKTQVTWTMTGKNNFAGKAIHLVMDIDKMVGKSFEEGLANIKAVVEPKTDDSNADKAKNVEAK